MYVFALPFEAMSKDDVSAMLTQRGYDLSTIDVRAKYNEIRADVIGRQAMGAVMVSSAVGLTMNGLMTGNGLSTTETSTKTGWFALTFY